MTYEWHTSDIRVIYEWHASTYEWHTSDIRVHTSDMSDIQIKSWCTMCFPKNSKCFMENLRVRDNDCIQNSDLLWIFNLTFWCYISVCNFRSMKTPVEQNSLLSKFFCYITWFVISPDETRLWTTCKRGLYVKSYCFFETIA